MTQEDDNLSREMVQNLMSKGDHFASVIDSVAHQAESIPAVKEVDGATRTVGQDMEMRAVVTFEPPGIFQGQPEEPDTPTDPEVRWIVPTGLLRWGDANGLVLRATVTRPEDEEMIAEFAYRANTPHSARERALHQLEEYFEEGCTPEEGLFAWLADQDEGLTKAEIAERLDRPEGEISDAVRAGREKREE